MTVNAAWPAANEIAAGAKPANRTANGSRTQSSVVFVPTSAHEARADDEPDHACPAAPRTTF